MQSTASLGYYRARAREYERIYDKPERQSDLRTLKAVLPEIFRGRSVLEVACGTGYWTQYLSLCAQSVMATDLSEETLAIAQQKALPVDTVRFQLADAFALPDSLGRFDAAFCGFWWSHIPRAAVGDFLKMLHARLVPGSIVVLLDNLFVPGSSSPISRTCIAGDTFQQRTLADGSSYEVLKNFPSQDELRAEVGGYADRVDYLSLPHYWCLQYRLAVK